MVLLNDIVDYCDRRLQIADIRDYPGAYNGLQVANGGQISRIGAAVDAGRIPFGLAVDLGIDFLIVHHGMFWTMPVPAVGSAYDKWKMLLTNNLAIYAAHLPLDCHPELGNNALLARKLNLSVEGWFLPYEGRPIAARVTAPSSRQVLRQRLEALFPGGVTAIEYGPEHPKGVGILTGSGSSAIPHLVPNGLDTLITGELRQEHFNNAQELGLNLYVCGHYATETFGVKALAEELSKKFSLPWEFIQTECPL